MPATSPAEPPPGGSGDLRPATAPRRPLGAVLEHVAGLSASPGWDPSTVLSGCTLNSRAVRPGDLYAALPGARAHGADFVAAAAAAGASAVLTDPAGRERAVQAGGGLAVLVADDPRRVLGDVAGCIHDFPARAMTMIGITGTNGKTTTAFLAEAGLRACGRRTGLIGTVETRIAGEVVDSVRTTPEAPELHSLLAVMRERGVESVAMEVSSHALSLGRVDGIVFDTAIFTNLSQDHLDFHHSMADYEAAKAQLFTPGRARRGLVNIDDPAGRRLAQHAEIALTTYGEGADWRATHLDLRPTESRFWLRGPGVDEKASVRLPGAFNVANTVAALAALVMNGLSLEMALEGVERLPGVPGRMETVDAGQDFTALVDYAHTPAAVSGLLTALRAVTRGRVIVVLGCGGERDRGKRPAMAAAAADGADMVVLTSDNPRGEDPELILAEMLAGAPDARHVVVEADRRRAIGRAVSAAAPGDTLVVAGKGHEKGQDVAGTVLPFDDRVVLREALAER